MEEPKCIEKIKKRESIEIEFCYKSECHFCNDPYDCPLPHYLQHLFKIEHKEY